MRTRAVVFEAPRRLALTSVSLMEPGEDDVSVEILWSGISTGTERLLYNGDMPPFPGMGYPLVPGYESVGVVSASAATGGPNTGDLVFVPGANCYRDVRGLFGGAAHSLHVPRNRVTEVPAELGVNASLLALAATAYHAIAASDSLEPPELIIGHGVLGRLVARICLALDAPAPVVWERQLSRQKTRVEYSVINPDDDDRFDYSRIMDASGDSQILDALIGRLARGGEIVLAGFYSDRVSFAFPPAFMREVSIRVAAEWQPPDLAAVLQLINDGRLSLDGLVTDEFNADKAPQAYHAAFSDPNCLKMVLDWRDVS